jgi:preprotein translocase subunit SecG
MTFCKYHYGCNGDYRYKQATTTVLSKNIVSLFAIFFSETIVLGMIWVMTENSEQLKWYNNSLRNDASDIIINYYVCNILGPEDIR